MPGLAVFPEWLRVPQTLGEPQRRAAGASWQGCTLFLRVLGNLPVCGGGSRGSGSAGGWRPGTRTSGSCSLNSTWSRVRRTNA